VDVAASAKSPTVSPANLVEYSATHTATQWSSSDIVRKFEDEWQEFGFRLRQRVAARRRFVLGITRLIVRRKRPSNSPRKETDAQPRHQHGSGG
jgi:hypothetical protein